MANKYSMIRQHQPLRTPAGWSGQEKAFIVQLEEIFDDIYRKFGRLGMNDMDKKFRVTIDGKYDIISGIEINENGIEVSGSKYVNILSGGKLYVSATNFVIDSENKYMKAGDWVFHNKGIHNVHSFIGNYETSDLPTSGLNYVMSFFVTNGTFEDDGLIFTLYNGRTLKKKIHFDFIEDELTHDFTVDLSGVDIIHAKKIYINSTEVKTKQTAKTNPTASGTELSFVDSITQDENGEITATRKTVRDYNGSTRVHGLVPAASASEINKYLRGDGNWATPPNDNTWRGFQTKTWDTSYTVNANSFKDITANDFGAYAIAGYTAVAVALFNPGNDKCWVSAIQVSATGTTPMMTVHNPTGNNLTNHAYISILYLQN